MQDFHFTMSTNKASPKLFLACANGEHIKSAKLTCRKAGKDQQDYLKVTFTDLLVSQFQTNGDANASTKNPAQAQRSERTPNRRDNASPANAAATYSPTL